MLHYTTVPVTAFQHVVSSENQNISGGAIYEIAVTRDAQGHVAAFSGSARVSARTRR